MIPRLLLLLALIALLPSCTGTRSQAGGKPGYDINRRAYTATDPATSSLIVSLFDQKAWLLNGSGEPVLSTDVSTGVPGKETPEGTFPVLERLETKRSNRYGRFVDIESREVIVKESWKHSGPPPPGTEYEGISMPYWMRLTWDGIGMHVGRFPKRTRASFGCIRVVGKAQELIYEKTRMGTPVTIVEGSLLPRFQQ